MCLLFHISQNIYTRYQAQSIFCTKLKMMKYFGSSIKV